MRRRREFFLADDEVKTLRNGFDENGNLTGVILGISV